MKSINTDISNSDVSAIFQPLHFPTSGLSVKNRLFRSSISGTFDDYNGHGTAARINWEESFAQGGIGAIISSFVPVALEGRILTRYATIDNDNKVDFWKLVGKAVHRHECKYILQLSHSGRQQDGGGVENLYRWVGSSTNKKDYFHGILCRSMSRTDIKNVIALFAEGARRVYEAGLDGVELHGANGYLITQFLSSGINDRSDEYGGSLENRARFVLEIVRAIRKRVKVPNARFHLQMKINAVDQNNWLYPWERKGNLLEDSIEICKILEDNGEGVDAIHVSSGSTFPHPRNPPGFIPVTEASRWYDVMLSSGVNTARNYWIFKNPVLGPLFRWWWNKRRGPLIEGINAEYAREIRKHVRVPVLCTGGFQNRKLIAQLIRENWVDGVTIARPLIANRKLPLILREKEAPDRPCTYCNKCLLNDLENPLGCYEITRYDGHDYETKYKNMLKELMEVFEPPMSSYLLEDRLSTCPARTGEQR